MIGFNDNNNDDLLFIYDTDGNIIEEKHYNGETFLFKYVFTYNENNQIISQQTRTEDD